ncbi:hypothetical protein [Botryobacter ruber]|uniref:hypothetical protein n=1 Tax=Botryobacter ruber TaxID=2171629 RepID=UPI000E0A7733|nr:hypothetical protein [Botryobacter ruber]
MRIVRTWVLTMLLATLAVGVQAQEKSKLEKDLASLRDWMSRKAGQADSITRAEWPVIKREFREMTASLDRNSNSMTETDKQEYGQLKSKYQTWEEKTEGSYGEPLNRDEARRWEIDLVGTSAISSVTAEEMRETFTYFMEQVRISRGLWNLRDWDYAEHVYLQLSDRKQQVLDKMTNGDKIKVAALQVEFNTLRKSHDVREKLESKKEKK